MNFLLGRPIFRGYVKLREGFVHEMMMPCTAVAFCVYDLIWKDCKGRTCLSRGLAICSEWNSSDDLRQNGEHVLFRHEPFDVGHYLRMMLQTPLFNDI